MGRWTWNTSHVLWECETSMLPSWANNGRRTVSSEKRRTPSRTEMLWLWLSWEVASSLSHRNWMPLCWQRWQMTSKALLQGQVFLKCGDYNWGEPAGVAWIAERSLYLTNQPQLGQGLSRNLENRNDSKVLVLWADARCDTTKDRFPVSVSSWKVNTSTLNTDVNSQKRGRKRQASRTRMTARGKMWYLVPRG